MTHRETRQWDSQFPGENLLLLQISANEKTKCENQLQSKWFRRKDTESFPSECSKMCCLRYISLYCLCIIMALKTTYSQSHRSVLYPTVWKESQFAVLKLDPALTLLTPADE